MRNKNFLLPSLIGGAVLALALKGLAGSLTRTKPASSRASGATSFEEIDTFIAEQMKRLKIPGAALAIVEGDQIVHLRGFGRACPGGEAPTPQTPFSIGSTTKSFTALAVMQLVEAGKIELDAPVQRYLPWFNPAPPQAFAQTPALPGKSTSVTVRHLLNQTGGLPLLPGWQLLADFDHRPDATQRQARSLSPLKLTHPAGAAFEYSNLNYNLLGLVIEAASGESYAAYLQNHIFDPLEMRHSYTSKAAAKRDGVAVGHQSWFGVPIAVPDLPMASGSLPSGQLISSAEDMGHYLIAHLNGGRCGDAQILSPEGIAELHRPAVDASSFGITQRYGMGWYIEEHDQTKIVWHSGIVPDFYAYMALLPEQKKGVALLFNVDHFTMQLTLTEVSSGVASRLAGNPPAPIRLGAIPWVQRGLLLIPALQIVEVAVTLGLIRRWRRDPGRRPKRRRIWGRHILLPLIPHVLVTLSLIPILGKLRGFLMLFAPDFSWIARISGSFAGIWIFLRTGLILRALRKPASPQSWLESVKPSYK
jgi:CubicO group peptidase (beta-lactamase class C family)